MLFLKGGDSDDVAFGMERYGHFQVSGLFSK